MKNTNLNPDVWDILKEDEKTAVSLSLGHGKSTWEAGEIMEKAHFKYLEIQKRARKFIEIFTNYFEKYHSLFPEELITLSFPFKEYLILTLIERKNISEAVKQMEDNSWSISSKRKKKLIEEIDNLRANKSEAASDLYGLIMDFDRWNNFRILPIEVQEPSAFKRRNKNRNLKHLSNITHLPEYSLKVIKEKYNYNGKFSKLYLPIVSEFLPDDYDIITVKNKPSIIDKVTHMGLFLFEKRDDAKAFSELVAGYMLNSVKNCKTGQKFWPEFRILLYKTFNYEKLENIHKSRKSLDKAMFDTDKRKIRSRREKELKGEERVDDELLFYNAD